MTQNAYSASIWRSSKSIWWICRF